MLAFVTLICGFSMGICGFFMGKYHERYEWNQLIKDGVIPCPRTKKNFYSK